MDDDGYYRYKSFFEEEPLLVIEWHDTETEAVGWLVINSLKNGAAGGGTRMRVGGTREESIFLAKTMEIKFGVSGPPIGGAKSVINFDHKDSRKAGVLRRWFEDISPYLRFCYGTAGDLNVTFDEVKPILRQLNIFDPQEGVVRGHLRPDENKIRDILSRLGLGVGLLVPFENDPCGPFNVEEMISGYSLARALHYFYQSKGDSLEGKKVLIEGFGTVGRASAYYLVEEGASIVGVCSRAGNNEGFRWAIDNDGLDVCNLIRHRDRSDLPVGSREGLELEEFWSTGADIFVPAAISHSITQDTLEDLPNLGISVIACGANNPFYINWAVKYENITQLVDHALETQREADQRLTIIPNFIANCGVARLFAYLMNEENINIDSSSILMDVDQTIKVAMDKLLTGYSDNVGILNRAYSLFITE